MLPHHLSASLRQTEVSALSAPPAAGRQPNLGYREIRAAYFHPSEVFHISVYRQFTSLQTTFTDPAPATTFTYLRKFNVLFFVLLPSLVCSAVDSSWLGPVLVLIASMLVYCVVMAFRETAGVPTSSLQLGMDELRAAAHRSGARTNQDC